MLEFLHQLLFLPRQASTFATKVDSLHYFVILTTFIMSLGVGTTALFFFVRYRRRSEAQRTPRVAPPVFVEVLFVTVPLGFFLAWFALGYRDYVWSVTPPKDAMDVYVMAKQWMWKFSYPEGPNSIGLLRVPAHRPVRLLLTSRDVIHSFFVPDLRVKMDVLPGRYTQLWFEATHTGRFQILCAEYCGLLHSQMWGEVLAVEPEEFDAWLADQRRGLLARQDAAPLAGEAVALEGSLAEQGRQLSLRHGCAKCHSVDGLRHIGPTWEDLYLRVETLSTGETVVADEPYLTESMMDPRAKVVAGYDPVMPSYQGKLGAPQTAALLEYIKSLRSDVARAMRPKGPAHEPDRGR